MIIVKQLICLIPAVRKVKEKIEILKKNNSRLELELIEKDKLLYKSIEESEQKRIILEEKVDEVFKLRKENERYKEENERYKEENERYKEENERYKEEKLNLILRDTLKPELKQFFASTNDPIRYGAIYLVIRDIYEKDISGSFAELGVWQGYTSKIVNKFAPDRKLYLFDTFEGFDQRDLTESLLDSSEIKEWFKNTSENNIVEEFENLKNIVIKKGYFPDTTSDLDPDERFAFVMIDFDIYKPIKEALDYFYDKVNKGGYIIVHDYNLPVFDWGAKKAVNEFTAERNIDLGFVQIPDGYGSIIIRKM